MKFILCYVLLVCGLCILFLFLRYVDRKLINKAIIYIAKCRIMSRKFPRTNETNLTLMSNDGNVNSICPIFCQIKPWVLIECAILGLRHLWPFPSKKLGYGLGVLTPKASPSSWVFSQAQHPIIKTFISVWSHGGCIAGTNVSLQRLTYA